MKCLKCQFESPGDMHFCGKCGASLARPEKPFDYSKTQTLVFSSRVLSDGSLFAGRYLVIDELGKGGMGRVYRVLDTKLDEEVALKFINPDVAADAKIIERFRNELKITRRITHRHVCRMYDLSQDDTSLFITMEYIPGEDLGNMIRRLGKLPMEKGFAIAQQVCEGLAEVQRLGVVHRDLKPKNIMIDKEGNAKIMDFGLARTPHGVRLTEVGHIVGTPSFMSPEQLNGETVDQRSDIFALGVIMFSMLTGVLPFEANSTLNLALQHKTHRPPNPHSLNPRIPEELARIILKCLEIDRARRYPSAQDLLADLNNASEMFDTYAIHVPGRAKKKIANLLFRPPWIKVLTGTAIVLALAASGLAVKTFLRRSRVNAERRQVIQEVDRLIKAEDFSSAYRLAQQAEREGRADARLAPLWQHMSSTLSILTTPPGAAVFLKDERMSGLEMESAGWTPLDRVRVPLSQVRIRIEKEGFDPVEDTVSYHGGSVHYLLAEKGEGAKSGPPRVDQVIQNETRRSYKISAGSDQAVRAGDQGSIFTREGNGAAERERVVARFSVKAPSRGRSLIEAFDQKEDIQPGYLIKFDEKVMAVPVTFITEPSRANILVDEIPMGISDDTFNLSPGTHTVKIRKPGYQDLTATLVVESGGPGRLRKEYKLVSQSSTLGSLVITSEPSEADIFLGGSRVPAGKTPFLKELPPGKVRIKISKADYQDQVEDIDLRPGERFPLYYPLTPQDGTVEISSDPEGADVYSRGEFIGTTPFKRALRPAIYKLRITLKGMGEREDIITVYPGETLAPLRYTFNKPRAAPARYILKVSSDPPGASVTINGVLQKEKTPFVWELNTAEVRLKIEKEKFRSQEEVLSLNPAPARNEKSFGLEKLSKPQLIISSSVAAQVFLDNRTLGISPPG